MSHAHRKIYVFSYYFFSLRKLLFMYHFNFAIIIMNPERRIVIKRIIAFLKQQTLDEVGNLKHYLLMTDLTKRTDKVGRVRNKRENERK